MKMLKWIPVIMAMILFSCNSGEKSATESMQEGPSVVEMRNVDGRYRLFVNGEEFYVKGAGCQYGSCMEIAAHGGNSFRTWSTGESTQATLETLDLAWENGLMVMMGLHVGKERHGFDYDDEVAVTEQLERLRKEVIDLKDHPALLGWGIGNELNLRYTNKKVWDAVNDIARMIKEEDGNHVVTTMLAGIGREEVEYITENCPDLDFISIQTYGSLINLEQRLKNADYVGPYLVTEWGPTGHWEMPETKWGSPIEQTSAEKAEAIKVRYEEVILADKANCMGSFVFLWGQKQERTPSWYGLFTEEGEKTEAINMMEYLWTGQWPENMAPRMKDITIEGKGGRFDDVMLEKNIEYTVKLDVEHTDMESLNVRAEVMPEPVELSEGGDFEARPSSIEGLIISANTTEVVFRAPAEKGAYRILVYVTDQHNQAGTANIPFFVE
ncbi:MAG: glycosyl hydrolase family 2 [Bacteroidales bacterium]